MEEFMPRFRLGVVAPRHNTVSDWAPYQFYHLVPRGVMLVLTALSPGLSAYTLESVMESMESWWDCVEQLVHHKSDRIELDGVPISALLGREHVLDLIGQTERKTGIPTSSRLESVVAAMQHLGVRTVTVGSRFRRELNDAIAKYLATGTEIRVVGQTTREQGATEAHAMTEEEGMNLALELGKEAIALAPEADAVFLPGGASVSTHAIAPLEAKSGKPVITNVNATLWNALRRTNTIPPILGGGKLLAG